MVWETNGSLEIRTMKVWTIFPHAVDLVQRKHNEVKLVSHHDMGHALRVANVAYRVARAEWRDQRTAELAFLAGICHNADRIIQVEQGLGRAKVRPELVERLIHKWLGPEPLTGDEREIIIGAVLQHDHVNADDDSNVQIALQDADRIVNLDVDAFMRCGQIAPNLPTVDYRHYISDPDAEYFDPRTVLRDMANALDWVRRGSRVRIRTRLGLRLAWPRAELVCACIRSLKRQLREEGVFPWPLPPLVSAL